MLQIIFTEQDADILYSIPMPPSDLTAIMRSFMFLNRAAAPTHQEFQGCLAKAFCVGILSVVGEKIVCSDNWYQIIHFADSTTENEIDALIEFSDWLIKQTFDVIRKNEFHVSIVEYESILESLAQN